MLRNGIFAAFVILSTSGQLSAADKESSVLSPQQLADIKSSAYELNAVGVYPLYLWRPEIWKPKDGQKPKFDQWNSLPNRVFATQWAHSFIRELSEETVRQLQADGQVVSVKQYQIIVAAQEKVFDRYIVRLDPKKVGALLPPPVGLDGKKVPSRREGELQTKCNFRFTIVVRDLIEQDVDQGLDFRKTYGGKFFARLRKAGLVVEPPADYDEIARYSGQKFEW